MAAGGVGSSFADVAIRELVNSLRKKASRDLLLAISAYVVGTQHRHLLGSLLKVIVALGGEV